MNYKTESLQWVRKHGQTNTDYISALHANDFIIDQAVEVAESPHDLELCELARVCALRVLRGES